jgi:hypothetical protein
MRPVLVSYQTTAATPANNMTFAQFIGNGSTGIIGVLNIIVIPFIGALAFLFFVWSVVNYFFLNSGNDEKRKEGRGFGALLGWLYFFQSGDW